MRVSRRTFLALAAASPSLMLGATRSASGPTNSLLIGTRLRPGDTELERGLAFGAAEAARTAAMFGWRVERVPLAGPGRVAPGAGVHAIVASIHHDGNDSPLPYMALTCDAAPRGAFIVAPCGGGSDTPDGRIVTWHDSLTRYGATQLNDRYRAATGRGMTGHAWLGWFAMKALAESAVRARSTDASALRDHLLDPTTKFDGHKGMPLAFDARGQLRQPLYELRRTGAGAWEVARQIEPVSP